MLIDLVRPGSQVGRLRVRSDADGPGLRLAAKHLVERADLRPSVLPPAAVLVVRRLADPAPRRLRPGGFAPDATWQAAARAALDELARRAARPVNGVVDPTADAVLFRDRAELLACLLGDLASDEVAARWWWRDICAPAEGRGVAAVLAHHAVYLPAAVASLPERVAATAFARLGGIERSTVVDAVARAHRAPRPTAPGSAVPAARGAETAAASTAVVVWLRQVAAPDRATRATRPGRVEHPVREGNRTHASEGRGPTAAEVVPPVADTGVASPERTDAAPLSGRVPRTQATTPSAVGHPEPPSPAMTARSQRSQSDRDAGVTSPARVEERSDDEPVSADRADPAVVPSSDVSLAFDLVEVITGDPGHDPEVGVTTELGGVFLLIGAVESLGIRSALGDLVGIGPWAALELMARVLVDPTGHLAADPIWPALAELDGRTEPLPTRLPGPMGTPARRAARVVRPRLAAALGLRPAEAVRHVVHRPARLLITSTHVDVLFPLETASLPLRRSGLDRDPGWLPRYGRVVAFHYREEGW